MGLYNRRDIPVGLGDTSHKDLYTKRNSTPVTLPRSTMRSRNLPFGGGSPKLEIMLGIPRPPMPSSSGDELKILLKEPDAMAFDLIWLATHRVAPNNVLLANPSGEEAPGVGSAQDNHFAAHSRTLAS